MPGTQSWGRLERKGEGSLDLEGKKRTLDLEGRGRGERDKKPSDLEGKGRTMSLEGMGEKRNLGLDAVSDSGHPDALLLHLFHKLVGVQPPVASVLQCRMNVVTHTFGARAILILISFGAMVDLVAPTSTASKHEGDKDAVALGYGARVKLSAYL